MNRKQLFIAYYTIVIKEMARIFRIWPQTLIPPIITTSLYFVIFGKIIGERMNYIEGFRYIDFIAPGLIMMSIIINSFNNTVASFFGVKFQKSIEELLTSPTPNYIIILGFTTGGVIRGCINGLLMFFITLYFTNINFSSPLLAFYIMFCTSMFFSIAGIINAMYAKNFDDIAWIPSFIITPLVYLSGVFYSTNMMPLFWKKLLLFNPIYYFINVFRYSVLDIKSPYCYITLVIMPILNLIIFFISLKLFDKKLKI